MQTTDDTSFAGHLMNRDYRLTHFDPLPKRKTFTFDITPEEFDREHQWFTKHHLADYRRVTNALGAAVRGEEGIKEATLRDWPDLRKVLEEVRS